jgi:phenylalanyl-tRNA synthetase beta subunit
MKVSLNWLRQYVDFNWSPEELAERLTLLGLEVEGVEKRGGEFEGIVVAEVLAREKHPNADKLSLCRVNDGRGERQIVCGAQNFQAGDKVPLILPGASLPLKPGDKEPFTIKVGKIRGVESHGMMCSPQELGLPDEVDGLLILRADAPVGQPFAEYLGRTGADVIYDLEVTPNRPDLNSVIGIAREIAAVTGNPLKLPANEVAETGASSAEAVAVRIDAPDLCPRYTARVVKGVKIGPSPAWLRETVEKVGIRSINNVVDVTNYVMLESGQPLHAFDYHLIGKAADGKPTVVVRRAQAGEKFTTLDGQEHELGGEELLIADAHKGIALAGVMGGLNTEIQPQTVDVLIESACFNASSVRRTSKALGLRTDASYRFERGSDIGICDWASRRAAQLIVQTAGGELAVGVVDVIGHQVGAILRARELETENAQIQLEQYSQLPGTTNPYEGLRFVAMRPSCVWQQLEGKLSDADIYSTLEGMGIHCVGGSFSGIPKRGSRTLRDTSGDWSVFAIPQDLSRVQSEKELIQEIANHKGLKVGPIPAYLPKLLSLRFSKSKDLIGIDIPHAEQISYLNRLGLETAEQQSDECTFRVPSWRVDLKREVDLIEEVARLYGVDRIPATPPRGALGSNAFDATYDLHSEVRRLLTGLGLNEAQGQTLIADAAAALAASPEVIVSLANPLSSDMSTLRPSLLPGLLEMLRHNAHRKEHDVALFEIGRVFRLRQGQPTEERRVAIALTGARNPDFWTGDKAKLDASDLKGIVEELIERISVRGVAYARREAPTSLFVESAEAKLGGKLWLGELGQLSPLIARKLDLRDPVFLAEFDLDQLLARRGAIGSFKPLPAFPASARDVAMVVPEGVTHDQVLLAVKKSRAEFLEAVELFDVFRGRNIAEGSKSLAYAFTYRHAERTLREDEVNASHAKVIAALRNDLGAVIRDQ